MEVGRRAHGAPRCALCAQQMGDSERAGGTPALRIPRVSHADGSLLAAGAKKSHLAVAFFLLLAERVGFEPTVGLILRLISSQVHSATLPPLRCSVFAHLPLLVKGGLASCCASCYAHSPPQENESIAGQQENRKSQPVKSCRFLCRLYRDQIAAGLSVVKPPMYGRNTSGIVTLPSACW
jgi:hypothetical protein